MDGLWYDEDIRHNEPNETGHRRDQFQRGWHKAVAGASYGEDTLRKLTWHNLGYRLGKLLRKTAPTLIEQEYDWCVKQQAAQ